MAVESRERADENSAKRISSSWEKNEPKSLGSVEGEMDTMRATAPNFFLQLCPLSHHQSAMVMWRFVGGAGQRCTERILAQ